MKIKDIKDRDNLMIKIEVDNDGSETIYKMLDRYDRSWPNNPWQVTFNMMFDTHWDYHDKHHMVIMSYSDFVKNCTYAERTILNFEVELDDNIATLILGE